jgi:hypothetical protein
MWLNYQFEGRFAHRGCFRFDRLGRHSMRRRQGSGIRPPYGANVTDIQEGTGQSDDPVGGGPPLSLALYGGSLLYGLDGTQISCPGSLPILAREQMRWRLSPPPSRVQRPGPRPCYLSQHAGAAFHSAITRTSGWAAL